MKYYLTNLCIEVTRRCNMACAHCLRGCAENMDIDKSYINSLLDHVDAIGSITFTGGEPSLNVEAIRYTLEQCKNRNIPVDSFYVVTNGKSNPIPLMIACLEWYAYCDCIDEGMCGLALSKDQFHDPIPQRHEDLLRGLAFFVEDKFTDFNHVKIINQGNAELLGGYSKVDQASRHDNFYFEMYDDNTAQIESLIYLSANGDIKTDCDISYDNDEYTIGNLSDSKFCDILDAQMRTNA